MTEPTEQPFLGHLLELRVRLVRTLLGIFIIFLLLFHWSGDIYHLLAKPLLDALPKGSNMIATEVTAPFFVPLKITLLVAFILALPNTLYQAWAFVAPGLYQHEKRLILPLIFTSTILFIIGMAFAYFLVFPVIFAFMSAATPAGVSMMTDIDKYLSFVLGMFIAFGVTFEVPIIVVILVRIGVISVDQLSKGRPYMIVGAFVIAAIVTPPDVMSQTLLAVPLWLLYEAGIIVSRLLIRRKKPDNTAHDTADL